MKTCRLIGVELFRFYRFLWFFLIMLALFLLSLYGFAVKGDAITEGGSSLEYLYMAISMGSLLVPLLSSVMTGIYVGREFNLKTINYEIMQGYGYARICLVKIITCGVIVPITVFFCMILFAGIVQGEGRAYSTMHFVAMLILLLRVFGCSVLYVMLMENGGQGGFFAFIRYTMLETLLNMLKLMPSSERLDNLRLSISFLVGWGIASDGSRALGRKETMIMLAGAAAEYLILLVLIYMIGHHGIKERKTK